MLYCVFYNKEIRGRFLSKDRAFNYIRDLRHKGIFDVTIKVMTKKDYETYVKNLILEETKEIKKWQDYIGN